MCIFDSLFLSALWMLFTMVAHLTISPSFLHHPSPFLVHSHRSAFSDSSSISFPTRSTIFRYPPKPFPAPLSPSLSASTSTSIPEAFGVTQSGNFSISDEDLHSCGFRIHCTMGDIDLDQLNSLFVKVGFPRRLKGKLERALQHTSSLRWLEEEKSGKVIAFARATGDDVFNAIIWDVVVDPSYQGMGLGKAVMERLMVDLVRKGITNIGLYAEPNVVGFYKPLGYIADPDGIRAMAYSRRGK